MSGGQPVFITTARLFVSLLCDESDSCLPWFLVGNKFIEASAGERKYPDHSANSFSRQRFCAQNLWREPSVCYAKAVV